MQRNFIPMSTVSTKCQSSIMLPFYWSNTNHVIRKKFDCLLSNASERWALLSPTGKSTEPRFCYSSNFIVCLHGDYQSKCNFVETPRKFTLAKKIRER